MEYYNQVPLEVMYGNNVTESSSNNIPCLVLSDKDSSIESSNPQDSDLYNKLLVVSYEVEQSDNTNQGGTTKKISSTSDNSQPNQVTIIPGNISFKNGIIIQYTYEGGNRVILLTSIVGER